LKGIHTLRI